MAGSGAPARRPEGSRGGEEGRTTRSVRPGRGRLWEKQHFCGFAYLFVFPARSLRSSPQFMSRRNDRLKGEGRRVRKPRRRVGGGSRTGEAL